MHTAALSQEYFHAGRLRRNGAMDGFVHESPVQLQSDKLETADIQIYEFFVVKTVEGKAGIFPGTESGCLKSPHGI